MENPSFAEQFGIPPIPETANVEALTGKYISALAELHGRMALDFRGKMPVDAVTARGATLTGAIMFVDIGAFTARSSELSPGQTNFWTNRFFSLVWPTCELFRATFDKSIGDALLLVFSPKLGCTTPMENALALAIEIISHDVWGYYPHIGIADGEFWLGYCGPACAMSLSVLGGTVNLAARLASKANEREICLPAPAWDRIKGTIKVGEKFSISTITDELKGFGRVPFVKLSCNTVWVPQCQTPMIVVDGEDATTNPDHSQ